MAPKKAPSVVYVDMLSKPIDTRVTLRCVNLDHDGNRCRKGAVIEDYVFENPDVEPNPGWYVVVLCREHWSQGPGRYEKEVGKEEK